MDISRVIELAHHSCSNCDVIVDQFHQNEIAFVFIVFFFFFSSRRRHTRSLCDWSSDVCSSDLPGSLIQVAASLLFRVRRMAFFLVLSTVSTFTFSGLSASVILSRILLALDCRSPRLLSNVFSPALSKMSTRTCLARRSMSPRILGSAVALEVVGCQATRGAR